MTKRTDRERAEMARSRCLDLSDSLWVPLNAILAVWSVMYKALRLFDGL